MALLKPVVDQAHPAGRLSARLHIWRRGFYRFRQSLLSLIGLLIVASLLVVALLGPELVPYPEHLSGGLNTASRLAPPSTVHWFGTNELGQDVFSLVVGGARVSLPAALAVVALCSVFGTIIGAISGYFGGWIDEILMRLADLQLTLPSLILAMAVAAVVGTGLGSMIFAIAVPYWPGYARLIRGEVMAKKEELFVQAARAMGASDRRILMHHILPNLMSPLIVKMSLDLGFVILTVASLGFVGIGVKPPTPEWGSLLSNARNYMPQYWWIAIFPGLAIFLSVFGCNLLGDGLRDVLDPRTRR